jgi:PPOX class probable F420-dependent enzyme
MLDGEELVFTTGAETLKGRALLRTGQASLCVDDDTPPFSFVTISGAASTSDDLDQVREWATRLGARYMGPERAEEYGARNAVPGELLVRLRCDHVLAERDIAD